MGPLAGLTSLTGGGGLSASPSSSATATGGDVSFGGISFGSQPVQGPVNNNLVLIAGLALVAFVVFKKV